MSDIVIKIDSISKQYRLGEVSTGNLSHDINRWWHNIRGKEDPYMKVGEENDRAVKGKADYVWALRDISFDLKRGDVLGIIGRNGAGKSTLLKILSRTTVPTTGVMKVKGRLASLLEVGTGFHPELSGRENIFLNGAILGMQKNEIKRKLPEIVEFSGVERYLDTPVKRYSSGMYVRLAFAVAAHLETEVLIVDEVLAVGDAEFQKKCLGRMKDVSRKDGRTVLFVSHNMPAIENLCKTGIVLNNGRVHSISDASSAIRSYLELNQRNSLDTDLGKRVDRQGNGSFKFVDVLILDGTTREEIVTISSGQDIIFRLVYSKSPGLILSNLVIALGVNDMLDNRILHVNNELIDFSFVDLNDNHDHIDILINHMPLSEGNYNITLFASINNEITDWIQNAYYFNVEGGDFYRTGKSIPSNGGYFLIDYKFDF
jgi:lipopolysaccharide transport system ATP-binding protein